jgi:aminomethyltransferase
MGASPDMQETLKETPLRAEHERLGGRMVPFAGWLMPVQYDGVKEEHLRTRQKVGLFDVSHMGEIRVRGPQSLATLQWLTTNDVAKLKAGEAQYSLFPNESGGIVDDLIVYCVEPGKDYLLCVNASNTDKDVAFVLAHNRGAEVVNESAHWGQIAVQGPRAIELLERAISPEVAAIGPFAFRELAFAGSRVLVARTGYTGEDGAEVFVPWEKTAELWRALLEKGADLGAGPVGLGARDTLRTEMKYSLYGHEIDDSTSPYEAGLGWVVKPGKKDFVGKGLILAAREAGLKRKLIGFELVDRGIAREGYSLFSFDRKEIGKVTSGTMSPSLGVSVGIAYVDLEHASEGAEFNVEIRGRGARARVVPTPFVRGTSLVSS